MGPTQAPIQLLSGNAAAPVEQPAPKADIHLVTRLITPKAQPALTRMDRQTDRDKNKFVFAFKGFTEATRERLIQMT